METQAIDDDFDEDLDTSNGPSSSRGKALAFLDCQGQRFELYEGDNIVGRSSVKDIEVKLADETVSDVHANLELTESGECVCRDLASNNGTFVESNPCSDTFISVKRSKKLVEHQCKIKFGSVIGLLTKNMDGSSPFRDIERDVVEKPKILDSDNNIAPVNLKFSISGSPSANSEVKHIGSEGSKKECKKRPYGQNQETQILDMNNISDSNSDNCSSPDEKGNACRDNSDTDVDEELELHTSRTRPKDKSAVKVDFAATSSSSPSSANNVAPINEIVLSDQNNESGDESDEESVDLLCEGSPSDSDEEDYHEVEHDENGDSLLDIERREAMEREEREETDRVESDEGEQTEEDEEDDVEEERLRREEVERIEEEEAEKEKEKERLRLEEEEEEEREEEERIEKEAEEAKRREEAEKEKEKERLRLEEEEREEEERIEKEAEEAKRREEADEEKEKERVRLEEEEEEREDKERLEEEAKRIEEEAEKEKEKVQLRLEEEAKRIEEEAEKEKEKVQLRLEEEAKRIEEEAEKEKEKVQLRLEEEAKRVEEEAEKEKEKVQLRLEEEEREEAKRSVMEEEKMMKMKVEDSDILRGGVADLQEGEEGALTHNNPGSSSSLPHCASQNEESSLSQRSGYSKACDMLLTASTAIASPSAAVLLGSNFKHGGSKAAHYNNDEEVQQTNAISSRRMTGRKSKRNEGQEADNISSSSAELITLVTDRKDDSPSDLITEVDNTVHRGKRAKTVKILPSSAVIETQATSISTVRSAKRTVESAQFSQVNNESEANDQQSQTSRIEGSARGKKTFLDDTERLSASSTSQSLPTGDRLDHGEKDEKIQKDNENPVRIINTGLLYGEEEFEELARACGAVVAALPCNATHIVTTDTIKRTPKLMIGINSGVRYIVTAAWLLDSVAKKKAIPISSMKSKYIVKDIAKEEKWGFKLADTLSTKRSTEADGIRVFSSCTFFLTDGVADVNAPSLGEIQSIVESGGGTWIHGTEAFIEFCRIRHTNYPQSFPSATSTSTATASTTSSSSSSTTESTKKKIAKSLECEPQSLESDSNKNIVILSSEAAYVSLGVHVRTAITSALQSQWVMGDGIYSLEVLFLAVLRQQLTFQSCNLLQSFQTSNSNSQSSDNIEDKKKGNSKTKKAK